MARKKKRYSRNVWAVYSTELIGCNAAVCRYCVHQMTSWDDHPCSVCMMAAPTMFEQEIDDEGGDDGERQ